MDGSWRESDRPPFSFLFNFQSRAHSSSPPDERRDRCVAQDNPITTGFGDRTTQLKVSSGQGVKEAIGGGSGGLQSSFELDDVQRGA